MILYESDPYLAEHLISPRYARRFLAEGDSWFSLGGLTSNLLDQIDREDWLIVSCAFPGDELRSMADLGNQAYQRMVNERHGCKWDGILLSGGGNDLLGWCWQVVNEEGIEPGRLSEFLDVIADALEKLIHLARAFGQRCPVFIHAYDYPTPKAKGGIFELGPWLGPQFEAVDLPRELWDFTITQLINALANWLRMVEQKIPGLHLVDARGKAATAVWGRFPWSHRGDWRNEIHLTNRGYRKHAAVWHGRINEVLLNGGRHG